MNKITTNIIVLLGIIATIFAGYFLFTQNSNSLLAPATSAQQLERLTTSSQLFVERSRTLSQTDMDTSIFQSPVFNALKSFSPPPDEFAVGRTNPFAPVSAVTPLGSQPTSVQ